MGQFRLKRDIWQVWDSSGDLAKVCQIVINVEHTGTRIKQLWQLCPAHGSCVAAEDVLEKQVPRVARQKRGPDLDSHA